LLQNPSPLDVVRREIAPDRPRYVSLMSADARAAAIERGIAGLYRWYSRHSQERRNWHADTCVDWRRVRRDHSPAVGTIVEGFFAVEQYTPDYVAPLLRVIRESYGRSQWHVRWGAEEERHADLWRNCVLALGRHTEATLDDFSRALRTREWQLPWESSRHMVFYQVLQERATQVSYLNLGLAVTGQSSRLPTPADEVLERICRLIAVDEAAHYHFFVEVARLLVYYEPEQSMDALVDVLRHFAMPARDIIPNYDSFASALHASGVFGRSVHYRDVVQVVLSALSAPALRTLEEGVRRARDVPSIDGARRTAAFIDTIDFASVEHKVQQLFSRNRSHVERSGLSHLFDSTWSPAWSAGDAARA
jgi:acyl-[acyl-carrier-protein] desaturase